jgi:hypothetical protein
MLKRLVIAAAFSLFYVSMYPILIGGGVIYVYPYWSPAAALAWVAGGMLVQAWFALRRSGTIRRSGVLSQVGRRTFVRSEHCRVVRRLLSELSARSCAAVQLIATIQT